MEGYEIVENEDALIEEALAGVVNRRAREDALRRYYANPNRCLHCGVIIPVSKCKSASHARKRKFCSVRCSADYHSHSAKTCSMCGKRICHVNQSGMCSSCLKRSQDETRILKWIETGETGTSVVSSIPNCIRSYIFEKQSGRCQICGITPEWNGVELHFILDHINGDASNSSEENLRLICPNCDSQLDTYKSRNKNSARSHRRTVKIVEDELDGCPEPT